jgi:putative tryptophan/tyrosine transport system substrate-binding protein
MSYGANRIDLFKRAAIYAGKILKGSKPGELPIEQPIKYDLVINLKAARTLDLEIPRDLLLVADEVIE